MVGRCGGGYNNLPRWTVNMYNVEHKPTKSQVFAQKICYIALNDWGFPIKALSPSGLEHLADEALRRFPKECDARFRKMAIGVFECFRGLVNGDYSSAYAEMFPFSRIGFHSPHL